MNNKELIFGVDFYDHCYYHKELYGKEKIKEFLEHCVDSGITKLLWRTSVCGKVFYHSKVRTVYDGADNREGSARASEVLRRFDPLEYAVDQGHRLGLKIYGWITIFDEYGVPGQESEFSRQHPEYSWVNRDGKRHFKGTTQ